MAANGSGRGVSWSLSPSAARVAAKPGPHTLVGADGGMLLRSLHVFGGSLVAGASLDQVTRTMDLYRASAPSRRPGSGLGLAIAAEIAAAHGGAARAGPVSPHGLRITLALPAASPGASLDGQTAQWAIPTGTRPGR